MILTDQAGLFDADPRKNPHAKIVERSRRQRSRGSRALAGGAGSALGKGGMLTKVLAARRAARSGAHTVIASGAEPDVLVRLARGERIGTLLTAQTVPLAARKQWLADHLTVSGRVRLDAGAVKALVRDGKSLLPIGVTEVAGEFERGEVVGLPRSRRARDRARPGELLVGRGAPDHAPALGRDRGDPRLRGRARAHPPGQSGAALATVAGSR